MLRTDFHFDLPQDLIAQRPAETRSGSRMLVLVQWAWSYWTYGRGARLIVGRQWRQFE